MIRLQKVLSQWGIASRRQAEKMILLGRVEVNGNIAHLGQKVNSHRDRIEVDGKIIKPEERSPSIYLLLNKPLGVVSTCKDTKNRPTVLDLLPPKLRQGQGIHPVGRLDAQSTGALLLVNDGSLTLTLTHPRYHLPKTYHVWVEGKPTKSLLETWRNGIILDGTKTLPAQVRPLKQRRGETLLEIVLREGRNRQIRRTASQLGLTVVSLHRISIGPIKLQLPGEPLLSGQYRPLKDFELDFLVSRRGTEARREQKRI